MLHSWAQGSALHLLILNNFNVEQNFHYDLFPTFSIDENLEKDRYAEYNFEPHSVKFCPAFLIGHFSKFSHVYFHELIHSSAYYTKRFDRLQGNCTWSVDGHDIVNLEERIADLGGMILTKVFDDPSKFKKTKATIIKIFEINPTKYALPWNDFEESVLFYLKNKDCEKVRKLLQSYKKVIQENNLTTVYEGHFDGTLSKT